jgi:hypothetical protein
MERDQQIEPELLTSQQVARILSVCPATVIRFFDGREGVVNIGTRHYKILRIPRAALNRFLAERRAA